MVKANALAMGVRRPVPTRFNADIEIMEFPQYQNDSGWLMRPAVPALPLHELPTAPTTHPDHEDGDLATVPASAQRIYES